MDLKNIKKITLNSKIVTKIERAGVIIYQSIKKLFASGYPLILENSKSADIEDYKAYGNSVQDGTPTPETPIEIKSVGDKTNSLIDFTNKKIGNTNWSISNVSLDSTKTYTFSCDVSSDFNKASGKNSIWNAQITTPTGSLVATGFMTTDFATAQGGRYSYTFTGASLFQIRSVNSYYSGECTNLQLSEGIQTFYEPYGYKVPIVASGKNLFDKNQAYFCISRPDSEGKLPIEVPSGKYTCSGYINVGDVERVTRNSVKDSKGQTFFSHWSYYNSDKELIKQEWTGLYIVKLPADTRYIVLATSVEREQEDILEYISTFQLELGDTATAYQPYVAPVTTTAYLSEPLRGIEEYKDVLGIATSGAKAVRNVGDKDLSTLSWILDATVPRWHAQILNMQNAGSQRVATGFMAEQYIGSTESVPTSNGKAFRYNNEIYCHNTSSTIAPNGKFVYPLATPTEETLVIPALKSFDGYTKITVDTEIEPSNSEATYYG